MATFHYQSQPTRTLIGAEPIRVYRRVTLNKDGLVIPADRNTFEIGVLDGPCFDEGLECPVRWVTAPGVHLVTTNGPIPLLGNIFAADNGLVSSTGTILLGRAIQAATAAGDIIEILRGHADGNSNRDNYQAIPNAVVSQPTGSLEK